MLIHLQHTELVRAKPETMFAVLTDYAAYPRWNRNVVSATVLRRDEHAAEVKAERTTLIEKHVQFIDSFAPKPCLRFDRRYAGAGENMKSTWIVEPAFDGQCYFTIIADAQLPWLQGTLQRPILQRMFYAINFPTFIQAAEALQASGSRLRQQPSPSDT